MIETGDPQVADQVLRYISNARWFAGKGRRARLRSLTPLPWLTETGEFFRPAAPPAVRFEIAEVSYPAEEDPEPSAAAADQLPNELESRDLAAVGAPEMAHELHAAPVEYYQLAVAYRSAPHTDLHHAEISRITDPDLGSVIAYDATQDPLVNLTSLRDKVTTLAAQGKLGRAEADDLIAGANEAMACVTDLQTQAAAAA